MCASWLAVRARAAGDMDDDDDDDDDDLLVGLARPKLNALAGQAPDDDDDDDDDADDADDAEVSRTMPTAQPACSEEESDDDPETEAAIGMVGAEAAFALDTAPDALELDPFRVAQGAVGGPAASESSTEGRKGSKAGAAIPRKIFVANLPHSIDDAGLVRVFARFGKVQEATVAMGAGGTSRGFGFVTFVSDKGSRFCLKEAGDPPSLAIEGRNCAVRSAETKDDHGARRHKMPARGNVDYLGLNAKKQGARDDAAAASQNHRSTARGDDDAAAPGIHMIADAQKRTLPHASASVPAAGSKRKKDHEEKGIVTVSRRQDAEPLNKAPITMREIFPKEFWRI